MRKLFVAVALLLCLPLASHAQLAQSFYNITNIKTDVLPNAIRITVETDGTVNMGVDATDFLNIVGGSDSNLSLLTIRHFRLRFVGAKAKIPAFVEVGKYPVDAVNVTLARDAFKFPFYFRNTFDPTTDSVTPAVDLDFRFYVPITVPYFTFEFGQGFGWTFSTGGGMKPREVSIAVGADHRSVIILIMNDRAETNRNMDGMKRSPPEQWKHHLTVTTAPAPDTRFTVDALHTPLADVLSQVARVTNLRLEAQPDVAERDITLFLPNADLAGLMRALSVGYGLSVAQRPASEGESLLFGATSTTLLSERIPIRYSSADSLRLLLPDFLLPYLRADSENNALLVTGSPALIRKVQEDVKKLDVAPAQIRVEARAYEIEDTEDNALSLSALFSQGKFAFDTNVGTVTTTLTDAQQAQYQATLAALVSQGKAKLAARPVVVVQSGNTGTLFFGQTRFQQVLVGSGFSTQSAQVIQIPVGTTIKVTPTAIADPDADILLDLSPRFSTVDATEVGTGLPTLGIREVQSTVRVRPGETIFVAGLLSESSSRTRRGIFGFGAKQQDKGSVALVVFVTAKRVAGG